MAPGQEDAGLLGRGQDLGPRQDLKCTQVQPLTLTVASPRLAANLSPKPAAQSAWSMGCDCTLAHRNSRQPGCCCDAGITPAESQGEVMLCATRAAKARASLPLLRVTAITSTDVLAW